MQDQNSTCVIMYIVQAQEVMVWYYVQVLM
jgi:hypothetical protein